MNPVLKLYPLIADLWKMDGGVAFGVVPKSIWNRTQMADENNMIPIVTRCLLVQAADRLVLIDTGMGNKRDAKYYQVRYREDSPTIVSSLASAGFSPADITDILFTHLHDDHVGAAVVRDDGGNLSELFPNAKYHVSTSQWEWAINPNKREGASYFKDNLLPLKESGKLLFIDQEGEWLPGISLRIYNGHTMGQIVPLLNYRNNTFVYCGDFIPTAYNIPIPFVPSVDIQPLLTMDEKLSFLEEACEKNYILLFEHDYFNECCTVHRTDKGIVMQKSFSFSSIS